MTVLTDELKKAVRYHLAYTDAAPDEYRALLEDRMDHLQDSTWITRIQRLIWICDDALRNTINSDPGYGIQLGALPYLKSKRILLGDVNRTDAEYTTDSIKQRKKWYLDSTDELAISLGVPNFRNPKFWGNLEFHMSGRIPRIPAPVEVTINLTLGTDLYLYYA